MPYVYTSTFTASASADPGVAASDVCNYFKHDAVTVDKIPCVLYAIQCYMEHIVALCHFTNLYMSGLSTGCSVARRLGTPLLVAWRITTGRRCPCGSLKWACRGGKRSMRGVWDEVWWRGPVVDHASGRVRFGLSSRPKFAMRDAALGFKRLRLRLCADDV